MHEGQAVEVTHLWGQQAMTLCRTALVGMASRLELHVRLSVHEHGCQRQAMADPNPNPNPNPNPDPDPDANPGLLANRSSRVPRPSERCAIDPRGVDAAKG